MQIKSSHVIWVVLLVTFISCTKQRKSSTNAIKPGAEQSAFIGQDSITSPDIFALIGKNAPVVVNSATPEFHELKLSGGNPAFTNYDPEHGYDFSFVQSLYADDEGYLWFGDANSLFRYDGHTFYKFNASNGLNIINSVNHILQDHAGNFWFSTWGDGVYKYDGRSFQSYFDSDLIADSNVLCMEEDKQYNIWFGTMGKEGLIKYNGETFETIRNTNGSTFDIIYDLMSDSKGRLWIASHEGVFVHDSGEFREMSNEGCLQGKNVASIYEDRSGNIWFCLRSDGLCMYDGETFKDYSQGNGFPAINAESLIQDHNGEYWIISSDGLYRFNGISFTAYSEAQGLSGNRLFVITLDKKGKIWIGSDKGLHRYDGDIISLFTSEEGFPSSYITQIITDNHNTVWVATIDGLVKYPAIRASDNSIGFERYTSKHGLRHSSISTILSDKEGNIWIGTAKGLSKFNGNTFVHYPITSGKEYTYIINLFQDKKGRIWYPHDFDGVSYLDGTNIYSYNAEQGLYSKYITGITEDREGNIWFAAYRGILSKYDGNSMINYKMPRLEESLDVMAISYLNEVQNEDIWMSSVGKVTRFDGNAFTYASNIEGLTGADYLQILEDTVNDIIWFGGMYGFTTLKSEYVSNPSIEDFSYYNFKTGYQILRANVFSIADDGVIWYGSGDNLGRFNPHLINQGSGPPVKITSMSINNENICWDALLEKDQGTLSLHDKGKVFAFCPYLSNEDIKRHKELYSNIRFDSVSGEPPVPVNPVLAHDQNNIYFEFAAVSTAYGKSIRYKYMLEGYDLSWSQLGYDYNARYAKVGSGKYIFRVKALSPSGYWSETSYTFRILPPWWKTWWAYSIYFILLVAFLIIVDRIQRRRVREKTLFASREKELMQVKEVEKAYHQLKTTQSQLIHAEKMASLGELTAGIAHEIQNPLNFVKNFSEVNLDLTQELLEEIDAGRTDELKSLAKDIIENEKKITYHGLRADSIVKSMLQHSRSGKEEKELTDLNALADESLRLTYHGLRAKEKSFKADYRIEPDDSLPKILVQPQEIGRVLINLINNAFYAVSKKGKKLDDSYNPLVIVSTKIIDAAVEVRVKDNGGGIPQDIIDKIFQPFFTTKSTGEGTGLGLSMSYDIITKGHRGDLTVESTENEGSEFIITLPVQSKDVK